jgi:hypothetical protein
MRSGKCARPWDEGNRFELKLRSGGGIQGNFTNIAKAGSTLVGYEIILRPVESQEVAKDSTGSRRTDAGGDAMQPSPAVGLPRERSTRVNPEGGGFELGGLPPGKYDLFLRKRAIRRLEDGAVIRPQEEPVQVGTVEIRPGETQTLKLEVP